MNDMISRHAVMNRIENEYRKWGDEYDVPQILGDIEDLPPAEPERKTGHWVYDENGMDWNLPAWVCSECHGRNGMIPTYIRGKDKMIKVEHPLMWAGSKYCPSCGAKMEEE